MGKQLTRNYITLNLTCMKILAEISRFLEELFEMMPAVKNSIH